MNGLLLIDKDRDWTSSDAVTKMRGVLHERRIGHGGTLDPLATGLLVLMVGRATRASDDIMGHDKTYHAVLRLGRTTDTQDITGKTLQESPVSVSNARLEEACARFIGEIDQIPPMYSAIKIGGKKLYEIARKGGEVERKSRRIRIESLTVTGRDGDDIALAVRCSSGTYIRTLCHDLGQALGCGGCMAALRRTEIGDFHIEDACRIGELTEMGRDRIAERLLPVDTVYAAYPAITVKPKDEEKLRHGAPIAFPGEDGLWRVYSAENGFLLLGRAGQGQLRIEKSFFEPKEG